MSIRFVITPEMFRLINSVYNKKPEALKVLTQKITQIAQEQGVFGEVKEEYLFQKLPWKLLTDLETRADIVKLSIKIPPKEVIDIKKGKDE